MVNEQDETAANQRTERAINVLRDYTDQSGAQAPSITSTSTGVLINYARELVRESS